MKPKDVIIKLMVNHEGLTKNDGSLNQNELARRANIPQPTITRIMNNTGYGISESIAGRLAEYFGVSKSQIRGDIVIGTNNINTEILMMWKRLSDAERRSIESLIRTMYNAKRQIQG